MVFSKRAAFAIRKFNEKSCYDLVFQLLKQRLGQIGVIVVGVR